MAAVTIWRKFWAAWAVAALVLTGCASTAEQPRSTGARPAMWKVADKDTTIYLFGTFHLLPKDYQWRTHRFDRALASADELVLEIADLGDQKAAAAAMMALGVSPGLPPLRERVPEEMRGRLDAMVRESGVPPAVLDRLETWAAALALTQVTFKQLGLTGEAGVEQVISAGSRETKRPIRGLETVEQQLGFFDGLSEDAQRTFLLAVLDSPGDVRQQFEKMLAAWAKGDQAGIAASFDEEAKLSPELRQALLTRRNARWAEWIKQRMDQPGTVLVAVGAGHLAGAGSVQEALKESGIRVRRVQ